MKHGGPNATMGGHLRLVRESRGVSQSSLARRTGVPQPAISRIEAGRETPSLERYRRLLAGLGLTAEVRLAPLREHRGDPRHFGALRRMAPGERLEQAASWQTFASEIRGKARGRS